MTKKIIRLLIVDDSEFMQKVLASLMQEADDIEIIGCAKNGVEAVALTKKLRPDLITMDVEMPGMNGFEATKQIMISHPTPIIIVTSHVDSKEYNTAFNALYAGALTVMEKPADIRSDNFSKIKNNFLNTIRALSEVHVIRHRIQKSQTPNKLSKLINAVSVDKTKIIALGVSTGGPEALCTILSHLPVEFPVPIVIVQHITDGFLPGLVAWLQRTVALKIEIIKENYQKLLPGYVYFAKDHIHLTIKNDNGPYALFEDSSAIDYFKPSITCLFSSLADSFPGESVAGLLTGMGKDGADGLLAMKKAHCHTFIQSESSCVVFGMPGYAKKINAECAIVDLDKVSDYLIKVTSKDKRHEKKDIID